MFGHLLELSSQISYFTIIIFRTALSTCTWLRGDDDICSLLFYNERYTSVDYGMSDYHHRKRHHN